jgi:hypothetical protein
MQFVSHRNIVCQVHSLDYSSIRLYNIHLPYSKRFRNRFSSYLQSILRIDHCHILKFGIHTLRSCIHLIFFSIIRHQHKKILIFMPIIQVWSDYWKEVENKMIFKELYIIPYYFFILCSHSTFVLLIIFHFIAD